MIPSFFASAPGMLGALVAASSKSGSSSSAESLIFILVIFGAGYFLFLRPQRRKLQQRQLQQVRSIDVGDEVVTQSGIIGTVVSLDEDRAEIQIASGVVITVVRAAIGRRVEPVVPYDPSSDEDEDHGDEDGQPEDDEIPGGDYQPPRPSFWRRLRGDL